MEGSASDEEILKRPVYLGSLIIGYQEVSPQKTYSNIEMHDMQNSNNGKRGRKRAFCYDDIEPIVIPQKTVSFVDESGVIRRLDLQELANRENASNSELLKSKTFKSDWEKSHVPPIDTKVIADEAEVVPLRVSLSEDCFNNNHILKPTVDLTDIPKTDAVDQTDTIFHLSLKTDVTFTESSKKQILPTPNQNQILPPTVVKNPLFIEAKSKVKTSLLHALKTMRNATRSNHSMLEQQSSPQIHTDTMYTRMTPPPPETRYGNEDQSSDSECEIVEEVIRVIHAPDVFPTEEPSVLQQLKHKFCNICGKGSLSRHELCSFLELNEKRLKRFLCLTCHQRFAPMERARHKAVCFLRHEEVSYDDWDQDEKENGEQFRMLACRNCADSAKQSEL